MLERVTSALVCILIASLFVGCADENEPEQYERGSNGESPSALSAIYSEEFIVTKTMYFDALSEFYKFTTVNGFGDVEFHECFNRVLKVKINKDSFPCIAITAMKGAPTKAYVSFGIVERDYFSRVCKELELVKSE